MKIVFTSCMDAERAPLQPVWRAIRAETPDVLMLLGDQIYMDWGLSLAEQPHWKKVIKKEGDKGLELFGREMHGRYARQWAVEDFSKLITWFMSRNAATPERLVTTWDEHDFAWNNAYGEGGDPRSVPAEVRQLSRRLFLQFRQVLCNPAAHAQYPAYPPPEFAGAPANGIGGEPFDIGGVRFLTLDERTFRTHRDEAGAHLLGPAQWDWLRGRLGAQPLTVVAGSSPLEHAYLLGHQGWTASPDAEHPNPRNYPDYQAFIDAASVSGKPVLYLAGDIHKNAWGGRLPGSPIVHAVSSGAALGNIFFKRFDPCYGVVTVDEAAVPPSAHVVLNRLRLSEDSKTFTPLPADRDFTLRYGAGGWVGEVPQGDTVKPGRFEGDSQLEADLTAFVARERGDAWRQQPDAFKPDPKDIGEIYQDKLPSTNEAWPDVVELERLDAQGRFSVSVQRSVQGGQDHAGYVTDALRAVFARAAQQHKKTVVLYVHGFGKGFGDSVGQAAALRHLCPEAEVALFSWGAGSNENLWETLASASLSNATQGANTYDAPKVYGKLLSVLQAFDAAAHGTGLKAVVVARSLGCSLLKQALLRRTALPNITRFVLSAPAVPANRHGKWLQGLPACVTINREDSKLKLLDWLKIGAHPLGLTPADPDAEADRTLYFDCTDLPGVALDHDYLFRHLNDDLTALNRRMVLGEPLGGDIAGFKPQSAGSPVYVAL